LSDNSICECSLRTVPGRSGGVSIFACTGKLHYTGTKAAPSIGRTWWGLAAGITEGQPLAARRRGDGDGMSLAECIAQLLLIAFPVAILALINARWR